MRLVLSLIVAATPVFAQNAPQQQTPAALLAAAQRVRDSDAAKALELAQNAVAALSKSADPSLALRAALMRCTLGMETGHDSLPQWAESALAAARVARNRRALGRAQVCHAYALDNNVGDQTAALVYYDSAIASGTETHNDTLLADAHVGRGELHYSRGDFVTSISDLTLAYRLFHRLRIESRQSYAVTALANLYADARVGQYDKALEYYQQVLAAHIKSGNKKEIAATYFNIGGTLERKPNMNEEALRYYRRALAIDMELNDPDEVAYDKRAIGVVLYHLNRPAEALVVIDEALAQFIKSGNPGYIAMTRLTRGIALRMLGRNLEAIEDLQAARDYFTRNENNRFLEWTNEHLALTYAAQGDWRQAYEARIAELDVRKKLDAQALDERTARMRVEFEAENKERENRALTRENATMRRIRQLQYTVLALSAVVIAFLALYGFRQVKNARRLRITALTDELTGLPNRRHLMLVANEQFKSAQASGKGLGVLILDIDRFKQINDTFGHLTGDEALRRVAQALQSTLRDADVVGRTGGDEFICVLPGATIATTYEIAGRIREAIALTSFRDVDPALHVTASVGASVIDSADTRFADIVQRADESLYSAKRSGHDHVAMAAASPD